MVDNLFKDRYAGRQPAWHGLGTVFTEPKSAVEAAKISRLDYNVIKSPLAGKIETPLGIDLVETGKVGLFREPTPDDPEWVYFGTASPEYEIIQNLDLARMLDRLTEVWPVETVGALGRGETIFFVLSAGTAAVSDEEIKQYFLVTDKKDGGTSLKAVFTPVRTVCQNTLVTALKQATVSAAFAHHSSMSGQLDFRVSMLAKLQQSQHLTMQAFERMASVVLSTGTEDEIFAAAYPEPTKPAKVNTLESFEAAELLEFPEIYDDLTKAQETWIYYVERAHSFRAQAKELFQRINDEHSNIANTAWAAYNAVVEAEDYRPGSDTAPASALFGTRAKAKKAAFSTAFSFVR